MPGSAPESQCPPRPGRRLTCRVRWARLRGCGRASTRGCGRWGQGGAARKVRRTHIRRWRLRVRAACLCRPSMSLSISSRLICAPAHRPPRAVSGVEAAAGSPLPRLLLAPPARRLRTRHAHLPLALLRRHRRLQLLDVLSPAPAPPRQPSATPAPIPPRRFAAVSGPRPPSRPRLGRRRGRPAPRLPPRLAPAKPEPALLTRACIALAQPRPRLHPTRAPSARLPATSWAMLMLVAV